MSHGARGDNEVLHHKLERYFQRQSNTTLVFEMFGDAMSIAASFASAGMFSVEQATYVTEVQLRRLGFEKLRERKSMAKAMRKLNRDWNAWRKNPQTATRLVISAYYGRVDSVSDLIFHGASPNAAVRPSTMPSLVLTALRAAVESKSREDGSAVSDEHSLQIVKMLINAGADINFADVHGVTALHVAMAARRTMLAHHLMLLGAKSDAKTLIVVPSEQETGAILEEIGHVLSRTRQLQLESGMSSGDMQLGGDLQSHEGEAEPAAACVDAQQNIMAQEPSSPDSTFISACILLSCAAAAACLFTVLKDAFACKSWLVCAGEQAAKLRFCQCFPPLQTSRCKPKANNGMPHHQTTTDVPRIFVAQPPAQFVCPISCHMMTDPVSTCVGQTCKKTRNRV